MDQLVEQLYCLSCFDFWVQFPEYDDSLFVCMFDSELNILKFWVVSQTTQANVRYH